MSFQAHARRDDPSTSHAAAASVGNLSDNQRAVLTVMRLRNFSMLDEQLIASYKMYQRPMKLPMQSESGLRSRRSELSKKGVLVEGEKRTMSTGRLGRTWSIATEDPS